ncbi:hypothetical protein AVEN_181902-1 [Araneus ventricosus]|uniref:Uncharacterized protein n=1 Tax=Araneus ventricosus TaxID=182803 RepID=A0A4Y2ULU7_ARAVE|nr:hypothetical protein AVEN_181902-1 [Araneus ventricosus]
MNPVLILSHGQASVERGFSVNRAIEVENLKDESYISQRLVYDYIKFCGGAAIFRKESELAKLRSALHSEENKVTDLTLEKQNLNDELKKKKKELEFYKKELESHREALSEKEEQEKLRAEELKDKKIEAEKETFCNTGARSGIVCMVNTRSQTKMADNADLLALLSEMNKSVEKGQEEMKKGQEEMKKGQEEMKNGQEEMKNQIQGVKGKIEEVRIEVQKEARGNRG